MSWGRGIILSDATSHWIHDYSLLWEMKKGCLSHATSTSILTGSCHIILISDTSSSCQPSRESKWCPPCSTYSITLCSAVQSAVWRSIASDSDVRYNIVYSIVRYNSPLIIVRALIHHTDGDEFHQIISGTVNLTREPRVRQDVGPVRRPYRQLKHIVHIIK